MTARASRLVDPSSMWQWVASQPGFLAAQLANPSSLTPLERWYFEARTITAQSSPTTSLLDPLNTDVSDMHVCCFDVHYAKNHTSHDSTQARAVYGRNTCNPKELARVDECFWFKTMQHGQVWHVSVARMADKYVLGSDIHIDEIKCSDLVPLLNGTFANFHDVIWGNGEAV